MLINFKVKNFKSFSDVLEFDLKKSRFTFNEEAIRDNYVNMALIYGHNGCGKSNLALAIFDVLLHTNETYKEIKNYNAGYLNLNSSEKDIQAEFDYTFLINGHFVEYRYIKLNPFELTFEELKIDNSIVLQYNYLSDEGKCLLKGAETLNLKSPDGKISKFKLVKNNSLLEDNEVNDTFKAFVKFLDGMLLFYNLMDRGFCGLKYNTELIEPAIINNNKVKEFEKFLHNAEINENLVVRKVLNRDLLCFKYKKGDIPFNEVASTGTKSLELFYYWYMQLENASFVFIDEFDAFYHYELSELIIKKMLEKKDIQVILTTHNNSLISNNLLRPDCYYILEDNIIKSFDKTTEKEIRQAHNLEKMYKAGAFNVKA